MAWTSGNDPWIKGGSKKFFNQGVTKEHHSGADRSAVSLTSLIPSSQLEQLNWSEKELKALSIANCLHTSTVATGCSRQVAAASMSAAINTILSISTCKVSDPGIQAGDLHHSISTAQVAQDMIAKHFEHDKTEINTLADALKVTRRIFPNALNRKLQELNSAASYDRHHGACKNNKLLDELAVALAAGPAAGHYLAPGSSEEDNGTIENKPHEANTSTIAVGSYVVTIKDDCKVDTGEEYHKLPFNTFLKVVDISPSRMRVQRISGGSSAQAYSGHMKLEDAISSYQVVPQECLPPNIVLEEKFKGEVITFAGDGYFDAGGKSRCITSSMRFKIKEFIGTHVEANLLDDEGRSEAYGKIKLGCLCHATAEPKKEDTT